MRTVQSDMTNVVSPFSTSIRAHAPPFDSVSAGGVGRTEVCANAGNANINARKTKGRFMLIMGVFNVFVFRMLVRKTTG